MLDRRYTSLATGKASKRNLFGFSKVIKDDASDDSNENCNTFFSSFVFGS